MALASLEIKFNGHKATANKRLFCCLFACLPRVNPWIHPDPEGDPPPPNPCSSFLWKL